MAAGDKSCAFTAMPISAMAPPALRGHPSFRVPVALSPAAPALLLAQASQELREPLRQPHPFRPPHQPQRLHPPRPSSTPPATT